MARRKAEKEAAEPTWASKRTKRNPAPPQDNPALDTKVSDKPKDLAIVCKPLQPVILEDAKEKAQLKANLEKIGCKCLLDFQSGHEEEKRLKEIYNKDMSAFPSTVRANPNLWKERLIAEVFGISKVEMGMS
jgi:hypothetical protein